MSRILWIEDEGYSELHQYKSPLIYAGHVVDTVISASKAIDHLRKYKYNMIILDLIIFAGPKFPNNEEYIGLELLKAIENNSIDGVRFDTEKIMVFSVVNNPSIHKEIFDLGVRKIEIKRLIELYELVEWVDEVLKY